MKPNLIAEACQNHNGDRETLKKMIHQASESGADYVKIQAIRSSELTIRDRFEEGILDENGELLTIKRPYKSEYKRLSKLDLSLDDEAWFIEECKRAGVKSMITVFTRSSARDIKDMGFDAIKVASYDCASYPLLKDVKKWWSTIVVSTGATYDHEVEKAAQELDGSDFAFLHCVTIYPTPMNECHLRRMDWLRQFTSKTGWSDHTLVEKDGIWASKIALALGANWIERHFTILEMDQTKDGPVSIKPRHLKELREFADKPLELRMELIKSQYPDWIASLGYAQRKLSTSELLNRDYYRGRFASMVDGKPVYNWENGLNNL
ncbi:MAG: N-acetylneuraminate synthase family protein [Candidatus Brocadiales bacterium]|nr:N-acetylneuraminate synthase family protein [Candidatus Brocadiales bacterium]